MNREELIAALESAEEGSDKLDEEIARHINWDEGDIEDEMYPNFTTSLDAFLPGEDIVSTEEWHSGDGESGWSARQRDYDWSVRGHTEPLARRLAALKAMEDV